MRRGQAPASPERASRTPRRALALALPVTTLSLALSCGGSASPTGPVESEAPEPQGRPSQELSPNLPDSPQRPRNLILISLDTLRADRLGAYGYHLPTSPNLDAFARRAVLFEDCTSPSTNTLSSHKSLLSGRHASAFLSSYAQARGSSRRAMAPRDYYQAAFEGWPSASLAQVLRKAGLTTQAFTDGGYMKTSYGLADGFDEYRSDRVGLETQIARAEAWLSRNGEKPFFMLLHAYDVHCPYDPPEALLRRFEPVCEGRLRWEETCGKTYFNALDLTADEKGHLGRHYDANILGADEKLGRFLGFLEQSGRLDDTVVVITSDHGESLGERGYVGHGRLHQNQLHIPLVIYVPGFRPGVVRAPVAAIDVMPTVLDLIIGRVPEGLDGWTLVGLLAAADAPRDDGDGGKREIARASLGAAMAANPSPQARAAAEFERRTRFASVTVNEGQGDVIRLRKIALLTPERLKLILDVATGQGELYDLASDPAESVDLSRSHPQRRSLVELATRHEPGPLPGLDDAVASDDELISPELRDELRSLGYLH